MTNITVEEYKDILDSHFVQSDNFINQIKRFVDSDTHMIKTDEIINYVDGTEKLKSSDYYALRKYFRTINHQEALSGLEKKKIKQSEESQYDEINSVIDIARILEDAGDDIKLFAALLYLRGDKPYMVHRDEYIVNLDDNTVRAKSFTYHFEEIWLTLHGLIDYLNENQIVDGPVHNFYFNKPLNYYIDALESYGCPVAHINKYHKKNIKKKLIKLSTIRQRFVPKEICVDIETKEAFYSLISEFFEENKRFPELKEFSKATCEWIKLEFGSYKTGLISHHDADIKKVAKYYVANRSTYPKSQYIEIILKRKEEIGRDPYSSHEVFHGSKILKVFGTMQEALDQVNLKKNQLKLGEWS